MIENSTEDEVVKRRFAWFTFRHFGWKQRCDLKCDGKHGMVADIERMTSRWKGGEAASLLLGKLFNI